MKLHGWCEKCRKVKRVTTSGRNITAQPIIGLCDECSETTCAPARVERPHRPDSPRQ